MSEDKMNWNDLANTRVGEVERPPLRPKGHYVGVINGRGETGESTKKGTLFITYPVQITEALEDVDADEIREAGGPNFKGEITFWLSQKALWMFTEFGQQLGGSDQLSIMELAEWIASCGEPIVFQGTHEPNERNPERPFFRLQNPVPLAAFQEQQARLANKS